MKLNLTFSVGSAKCHSSLDENIMLSYSPNLSFAEANVQHILEHDYYMVLF